MDQRYQVVSSEIAARLAGFQEHIANKRTNSVHFNFNETRRRFSGERQFVGHPNPRHKERKMAAAALRVIEGTSSMDKSKALDAALSQIERNFGKGSIRSMPGSSAATSMIC
jgi:ribosomal protein L28